MNAASSDKPQAASRKSKKGGAILVLEDDGNARSFTVAALAKLGYRVFEAADADAAMSVLAKEGETVDLLLSDIALADNVGGPELAARAKDLYPNLKLLFMSAYAEELYSGAKVPGFQETLLIKPFDLADLAKAVDGALAA